jgi:hypothetical protein
MALADQANRYIDERKPWEIAKEGRRERSCWRSSPPASTCSARSVYLKPILPETIARAEEFLRIAPLRWEDAATPLLDHEVAPYQPLLTRLDRAAVDAMIEASRQEQAAAPQAGAAAAPAEAVERAPVDPLEPGIVIDDFAKVDLRVARVLRADPVEGADKLLRLRLDVGDHQRTVFAGIKAAYPAESLEGGWWWWSPTWRRARCASGSPRGWCWRRDRAGRACSCSRPTRERSPASGCAERAREPSRSPSVERPGAVARPAAAAPRTASGRPSRFADPARRQR